MNNLTEFLHKALLESKRVASQYDSTLIKNLNLGLVKKQHLKALEPHDILPFKDLVDYIVFPTIGGLIAYHPTTNDTVQSEGSTQINLRALKVFKEIHATKDIKSFLNLNKPNAVPILNIKELLKSKVETIIIEDEDLIPILNQHKQFTLIYKDKKIQIGTIEKEKPVFKDDEVTFTYKQVKYLIRGLKSINPIKLRVICTVYYNDLVHTDRIDLYSFKSRRNFSNVLADELGLSAQTCEKQLLLIQQHLEAYTKEKSQELKDEPIILTDEERKEAIAFLKSKNLVGRITKDIASNGYIGESNNTLMAYLVSTSRKLSSPLSAQIRSQSGAGKSFLMEKVSEFMPREDVLFFSRITAQSLYYMEKDGLCNKLLIIDEASGSDEAEYSIRTLQSRKKLSMAVVMKDPNTGKQRTKFFEILGPIAYMDSSTSYTNPENENRCFMISLDESQEQTKLVMQAQMNKRMKGSSTSNDDTIPLHQNAQRVLRQFKVIIPFVDKIRFPVNFLRVRRDFDRFLSLVEASAFLHQYQRKIEGEYIIASIEDYKIAYNLQQDVIQSSLCELNPMCKEIYDLIKSKGVEEFTRKDVRNWSMKQDYVIKRIMRELESMEYIFKRINGSGGRYIYHLADVPLINPKNTMITPEKLLEQV